MNITPAIYDILRNDPTVKSYVGDRIYPKQIPQGVVYPAITQDIESSEYVQSKDNTSSTALRATILLTIFFEKFSDGKAVADQTRALLDRYSGSIAGINIQRAYFENQQDNEFIDELETHVITQRYYIRAYS